jgi:hypothetical protein
MKEKENNRVLICPVLPEKVVRKYGASFAANNFCTNLLSKKGLFDKVMVSLPVRPITLKDLEYNNSIIMPAYFKRFRKSPFLSRLAFIPESWMMFRQLKNGDSVWFYNLAYTLAPLFILIGVFKRKVKRNIIILDYTPGSRGVRGIIENCLLFLLNKADGTICLSPNDIFTSKNTACIAGIVPDQLVESPRISEIKTEFLISGSLVEHISMLHTLLIPTFKILSNYTFHITGQSPNEDLLKREISSTPNIIYHGNISSEQYFRLLHRITFLFSTRNPMLPENQCNFPSKIIESLLHNTIVISTIAYKQLEGIKYFKVDTDCEAFKRQVSEICSKPNDDLMDYANQTGVVREMFSTKVWNETIKDIENNIK